MSARLNRRGAILPMTILMLAIMAVAVAITYARLSSEHRTTGDAQAQMAAFHVAQSGLSRYLSNLPTGTKPGWGTATATYNDLPGGTATVTMRMVRDSTVGLLPSIYAITSVGTNTTARRYGASAAPAQRTVATYALWTPTPFDLNGAFTSLTGVQINGNSAVLSGIDRCAGGLTIPGVAVPNDQFTATHPQVVDGNPDNDEFDLGTPGSGGTAKDQVGIDWNGIKNGTVLPADYTSPSWPSDFSNWPVTRVNNDGGPEFMLPSSGKGILIVTGDLRMNGATPIHTWEGIMLVGGRVVMNGNSSIYGAIVSGLNLKLGQAVGDSDLGNGTKTIQYDSCALTRALGHIGSIQRVRNAWTDTWPSY